jgi:hypothetical protein
VGNCIFCGGPAGLFLHEHRACRERHDTVENKITHFFAEALASSIPAQRFRELTEELAQSAFIRGNDFRDLVLRGFAELINTALAENLLTESEENRVSSLMKTFGLNVNELTVLNSGSRLAKASILRQLSEGRLPTSLPRIEGQVPINLERDEVIIWVFNNTSYFTPRTRTQYGGGSQGVSIRIMKGVYYRASVFKGAPVQTQYLSNEGAGLLVITNRNVYFLSSLKAFKIPAQKIIAIEPHSDGLTISRDGASSKPAIFTLDDPWFAANAISHLNQLQATEHDHRRSVGSSHG